MVGTTDYPLSCEVATAVPAAADQSILAPSQELATTNKPFKVTALSRNGAGERIGCTMFVQRQLTAAFI
jgi:hypothetical protein